MGYYLDEANSPHTFQAFFYFLIKYHNKRHLHGCVSFPKEEQLQAAALPPSVPLESANMQGLGEEKKERWESPDQS